MGRNRELAEAKRNYDDLLLRGEEAIGGDALELLDSLMTTEEIAESDLAASLIGELVRARTEMGITQKELERLSGVRQPVIARIESGRNSPQLHTLVRVLAPLGKTLAIVPLESK